MEMDRSSRSALTRITLIGTLLALGTSACASQPASSRPRASGEPSSQAPAPKRSVGHPTACPSQTFEVFLRKFADAGDDSVRKAFTAMPLEYSVPTHTLRDDTTNLSPFTVTQVKTPERSQYFAYRYFPRIGDYRPVGLHEEALQEALAEAPGGYKYPIAITTKPNGDREVAMGMETEMDIYLFARKRGCWVLTRATNPRD